MSLTYTSNATTLAQLCKRANVLASDTDFTAILPSAIDDAELRIYRELDLLTTVTPNTSVTCTASSRILQYAAGLFVTFQSINIITPVDAVSADTGARNPCVPVSKEYLNYAWPSSTGADVPREFAMLDDRTILLGPWPDAAYKVEALGTVRPAALSASNTTTYLSTYLPDVFLAAEMVYLSGWMRNFGAQADDPRMGMSWDQHYQTLVAGANVEELRKKFMGGSWSSQPPSPIASPPRN